MFSIDDCSVCEGGFYILFLEYFIELVIIDGVDFFGELVFVILFFYYILFFDFLLMYEEVF